MNRRMTLSISAMASLGLALLPGSIVSITGTLAQAPKASVTAPATALKTPWGEPDLQGIWTDEFDTPFQRSPKYANQEFFTPAQRQELDKLRGAHYGDDPRQS